MQIQLIEGYHITATQKRHIAQLLERGDKQGRTSRTAYEIDADPLGRPDHHRVTTRQAERDDFGRRQVRNSVVTIKAKVTTC